MGMRAVLACLFSRSKQSDEREQNMKPTVARQQQRAKLSDSWYES